jgi:hypothetical protein
MASILFGSWWIMLVVTRYVSGLILSRADYSCLSNQIMSDGIHIIWKLVDYVSCDSLCFRSHFV